MNTNRDCRECLDGGLQAGRRDFDARTIYDYVLVRGDGVCTVALLTGIIANAFASQVSRKKDILMAEVSHALQDGVISEDEFEKIEHLRRELNLPEAQVRAIVEIMYKDR